MIERLRDGIAFDSSVLAGGVGQLILDLSQRYWEISRLTNKKKLHALILIAAGIHPPLRAAIKQFSDNRQPDFPEMLKELRQLDELTKSILSDGESETEDGVPAIDAG